ncbi:hypothetical protein K438DRAFT_1977687 [Mycena galopus ATCC 62051]|nr:hypothetical protein K438DRAFT_1977687 [Mycena galopus ATCC 62051]
MQGLVPPSALVIARKVGPHARCCGCTVLAPRHVDTGLITSTRGSLRRRRARDLNAGLANSTCASPPRQRAPYLLDAGLAISTRASPPRHLDTRIPTCTRTSLMYLRLDGLVTSTCASPSRLAPRHLDAGLDSTRSSGSQRRAHHFDAISTRASRPRLAPRHVEATSTWDSGPGSPPCHLDAGLPTLTLGSEPRHLDTGFATLTPSLLLHVLLRAEHNVLLA